MVKLWKRRKSDYTYGFMDLGLIKKKKKVKQHCCEVFSLQHVMQDQENVKSFLPTPGWLTHFKQKGMKNVKCTCEVGSADQDQDAVEEYRLSVNTGKRDIESSRFSTLMELACFHKVSGNWMYMIQVVFKAPDFKSFRNQLCANAKAIFNPPLGA